jgi:hypothetical protein
MGHVLSAFSEDVTAEISELLGKKSDNSEFQTTLATHLDKLRVGNG